VALSRSRESLIVVGTTGGLGQTLPPDALLIRALQAIRERGQVIDGARLARDGHNLLGG